MLPYPYNLLAEVYGEDAAADMVLDDDQQEGLRHALSTLSDREREILRQRFEECLTYEEAAKTWHVTRERVRQIEQKALRKLRHPSQLKYIAQGYAFASGALEQQVRERHAARLAELEEQVRERHAARLAELEEQYNKRISALEDKLLNDKLPPDHVLAKGIESLELSARTYNVLHRAGIDTIREFLELSDDRMMMMRNMGMKSVAEVHQVQKTIIAGNISSCVTNVSEPIENRWISVSERMPEIGVPVLVTYLNAIDGTPQGDSVAAQLFGENCWYWWEGSVEDCDCEVRVEITHWMPLPEPPKEEQPW